MLVVNKYWWPHIGGFTAVIYSNACNINDGAMIIKYYHRVLKPWLQTINVSASSYKRALVICYGCPSHLNIDLPKELGVRGMVVLL